METDCVGHSGSRFQLAAATTKETCDARGYLSTQNSLTDLHSEWSGGDTTIGDRWVSIGTGLSQGRFVNAIEYLIEQSANVLAARGGAAWVEKNRGKLNVRFVDENGSLPSQDELGGFWRFPYFLDSLLSVALLLRNESKTTFPSGSGFQPQSARSGGWKPPPRSRNRKLFLSRYFGRNPVTEFPREALSDQFQLRTEGRRLVSSVLRTYQFDPGFFEQEVLKVFVDIPLSHASAIRLLQLEDAIRDLKVEIAV